MQAALAGEIDSILFAGDLSYADGDGHRWDSYARLYEPLWASVPTAHAGGNHEVGNGGENWLGYSNRSSDLFPSHPDASLMWRLLQVPERARRLWLCFLPLVLL